MDSRDRILAAIAHKEPDRAPVDLGSTPSSGISAIAYNNFKKYLGVQTGHTRVYDVVQQIAEPEDWVLDQFAVDVLDVGRAFNTSDADWYMADLPDGSAAEYPIWFRPIRRPDGRSDVLAADGRHIATMLQGATFFDQTCFPYLDGYPADFRSLPEAMNKVHWAALAHSPWDRAQQADFWTQLRQKALFLRQNSSRALVLTCGCNLFEWGTFLRRIDNFLMDLVLDTRKVEQLLDTLIAQHLATLEKVCAAVGDIVDIIRFGDDLGMETGPFMSREIYRRFFKPRHAVLYDYVKRHSQLYTFLHTCGSVYDFIPDFIEIGLEIINPVQTTCRNMEPGRLKREFRRDITFWGGGCDTQSILNRATPAQVKAHIKRRLDIFSSGGGFVFSAEHNILPDVPPENIIAAFEAASEYSC